MRASGLFSGERPSAGSLTDHCAGSLKFAFQVDCISISKESPFRGSALRIRSGWSLTWAGSS